MRDKIRKILIEAVEGLYGTKPEGKDIQIQLTKKEFSGDLTVVVFPLVKYSKKKPEATANDLAVFIKHKIEDITSYNVIKGFLNFTISGEYWINCLNNSIKKFDGKLTTDNPKDIMIEFSSPNTNKPLHLGHIRNNLIGDSISRILEANGHNVIKSNLINDRGIHICKSMQAYLDFDPDGSPEKSGIKGDKYVGELYVKFEQVFKKEYEDLLQKGYSKEEARKESPIMKKAQKLLNKWEKGEDEVMKLWEKMNSWVYKGFDSTYSKLGVSFDKTYYESETYKTGKQIVKDGVKNGVFYKKDDGSIWADLSDLKIDDKLLLRSDETSVYITQDIGTAVQRFEKINPDKHIYVVGNEQNHHFQVLKSVLKKLKYSWADNIEHLSYGMVELPEGKMKSREGKVVDADDLINEMVITSKSLSSEVGKIKEMSKEEQEQVYSTIALGALKYFILKVDPVKNMVFNPKDSIDFNGNTGPFIQYTHARIKSIVRKASKMNISVPRMTPEDILFNNQELNLIKYIERYKPVLKEAGENRDPGLIANYAYELAKKFNRYYHDYSILKADNGNKLQFRLMLADSVAKILKFAMNNLGIKVPEKM